MLVATPEKNRLRSGSSFAISVAVHASVLAWVALAPLVPPARPGLYNQEIKPYEDRIVWYNLNERLPEITPLQRDPRPSRARARARQNLVSGSQEDQRPRQLIWMPAPEIATEQRVPAPNVLALATAAGPRRDFTLPPALVRPEKPVTLPEAPPVEMARLKPVELAAPAGPKPRAFQAPRETPAQILKPALPAAPELTIANDHTTTAASLLPPVEMARRTFIPPLEAVHRPVAPVVDLAAAPRIEVQLSQTAPLLLGASTRAIRRFVPPAADRAAAPGGANLPGAPPIEEGNQADPLVLPVAPSRVLRPFAALAKTRDPVASGTTPLADAPSVQTISHPSAAALAIVSLFPARDAPVPALRASQKAGFSAGPQPRPEGSDSSAQASPLTVPGLLVRDGAKESRPTLMATLEAPTAPANLSAAARSVQAAAPATAVDSPARRTTVVPDPRWSGRLVYTIAIQMPNITSYSGSWIVWFAEHEPMRDQPAPVMQVPLPVRKVDPKYIPAAADEKVEGKVRLAATIRRDGRVERVELLQHLDDRLDQSSQEALSKWEFEPALRNGVPIDVDAVFEIPFHIAPKVSK
jgi:TonB family protein